MNRKKRYEKPEPMRISRIGSGFTIYSVTASIAAAYHAPPFGQTNASS